MVLPVLILEKNIEIFSNIRQMLSAPDPLGDGAVLLLLLGELALDAEGLQGGHDLLERNYSLNKVCYFNRMCKNFGQ